MAISDTTQHYVQQALGQNYHYRRSVDKDIDKELLFIANKFIKFEKGNFNGNDDKEINNLSYSNLSVNLWDITSTRI